LSDRGVSRHVTTLVICVDRSGAIGRATNVPMPVAGWEAVRSLVTDAGLDDPEDASVNCLLESLRVARDLRDEREESVVAVVSAESDTAVGADRSIAAQLDDLVERYDPRAAIVVVDSAEDERVLPVVESRIPVDSVDRVVVRQARDIESTYYLLKQFLADEQLRSTVLVPIGVALLLLPALFTWFSAGEAAAGVTGLLGAALLYKGLAIDRLVAGMPERIREALYAGQVSVVTYVVAGGLALVGGFFGFLAASNLGPGSARLVEAVEFVYSAVPWFAIAGVTASVGRLLDELIRDEEIRTPYLNLPFVIAAVALVVRGFAGYFLAQEAIHEPLSVYGAAMTPVQQLASFIVGGIVVSLVGVKVASDVGTETLEDVIDTERDADGRRE
jgi:putative membrane protein